jgi:hypothetical protein
MATVSFAGSEESMTEFLTHGSDAEAADDEKEKEKKFSDREEDSAALEELIFESAAQAGVVGDYEDYSQQLAKTLSMLTPAQQARIFN